MIELQDVLLKFYPSFQGITFFEKDHKYIRNIGGKKIKYLSGTSIIKEIKEPFDRVKVAKEFVERNDIDLPSVFFEKQWEHEGVIGSDKGSIVHSFTENFIQNKIINEDEIKLISKQNLSTMNNIKASMAKIEELFNRGFIHIASEKIVYDDEYEKCGTIDQIWYNTETKKLAIWDWKTNKKITTKAFKNKKFLAPISHLEDCKLNEYSLQLSIYKYFVCKNLNIDPLDVEIVICHFPPTEIVAVEFEALYFEKEVIDILNFLKK